MKVLNIVSSVGKSIDAVEKKALTPKGIGLIINAFVLLTMFVGCTEKMTNPYSEVKSESMASLPPLDSFQVSAIGSSEVTPTETKLDTVSSHTQLIVQERPTPKLDSLEVVESEKSAITKTAPSTIATSTKINKAPKAIKAKIGSGLIGIKHSYDCMCEVKASVDNPSKTASYFARKANLTLPQFIALQKPQVFSSRQKGTLKLGVQICLKRGDCLK